MSDAGRPAPFFYVLDDPLHLLFVDDDPILREFALVHLASDKTQITMAEDGDIALVKVHECKPDIVLLDLGLPRVDGFSVLRSLRANPATKNLPVIVVTGREDVAAVDRAFQEGATSFVVKPINWRLLTYQIRFVQRARLTEVALHERIEESERTKGELERASNELVTALRGSAAASEAKSRFLAAMSHELRTPLNAILGFSEVLHAELFGPIGNERYLDFTRDIHTSGAHLLSMINNILDLAHLGPEQCVLDETALNIQDLVDEAVRIARPLASAKGIALNASHSPNPVILKADKHRIRQVLLNLISNAIKFSAPGSDVRIEYDMWGKDFAITVSDTGIGIVAEDIPNVLDRFTQIDDGLARKFDGAGVGLPLARQFMEMHQGRIEIKSALGAGTSVSIVFPSERVAGEPAFLPPVIRSA